MSSLSKPHFMTTFIFNVVFETCRKNSFKVDEEEDKRAGKQVIKLKDFIDTLK